MTRITLFSASILALTMAACSGPADETGAPEGTSPETETVAPEAAEASEPEAETAEAATVDAVELIKLDCGSIYVSDLDIFSSAGDYAGQTDTLTDTCWLVRHPEGNLLWDLGLPGNLVGAGEQTNGVFTVSMDTSLEDQLAAMDLAMADIDYLAISHSHFDHVGQAGAIDADATEWLVNESEYDFMFPADTQEGEASEADVDYSAFEPLRHTIIGDDYDVFGDGSVVIFETPGHTPGHASLLVNLPETGPVLLTGDLYHRVESRELKRVPQFNTDEAATLASMEAFEAKADELGAKVIIQHEPADTDGLPDVMR
ncbi:N-acyl homoserine lactonase family protein [Henriciella litoralis]|uniref:N-acyl homoserine lactonase family protein n=1 Tax=Henriciella litoralis TaxID=568102 RepID=UPI000A0136F2|nr:N-acyl homoserine lactonase family protein [Henriciella litoralis]